MVSSEKLPEDIVHLLVASTLVKNIAVDLDAGLLLVPVFDMDFANVAQTTDVDCTKLGKLP